MANEQSHSQADKVTIGIALAMRYKLQRSNQLRAQGKVKVDDHPALYLYLTLKWCSMD